MRTSDDARDHSNCPPQQNSRHCICKQALQPLLSKHNFNAIHILTTLNGEFQQQVTLPRSSERPLARATIIQAQDRHRSCKMRAAVLPFRSAILAARPEDPALPSEPEELNSTPRDFRVSRIARIKSCRIWSFNPVANQTASALPSCINTVESMSTFNLQTPYVPL